MGFLKIGVGSRAIVAGGLLLWTLLGCAAPSSTAEAVRNSVSLDGLVLADRSGARHDLGASLRAGRPSVFVFWQTWCASCRAEGPALAAAAREWAGKLDFYGVVSGPDEVVDGAALDALTEKFAFTYPQLRDPDGAVAGRFRVEATPTIVIVGVDGEERYRGRELPADWNAFVAR